MKSLSMKKSALSALLLCAALTLSACANTSAADTSGDDAASTAASTSAEENAGEDVLSEADGQDANDNVQKEKIDASKLNRRVLIDDADECDDPVEVVKSAIERLAAKSYMEEVEFISAELDEASAQRYSALYKGSEKAQEWNITDEMFDNGQVVSVAADYYVAYSDSVPYYGGEQIGDHFFLWQNAESGLWYIFDKTGNMWPTLEEGEKAVRTSCYTPEYTDPVETVKSHLERFTLSEATLDFEFKSAELSENATNYYTYYYKGSEAALAWNLTDEMFDEGRVAVVYAEYYVEYDGTKTSSDSGDTVMNYCLWKDEDTGYWYIFDSGPDLGWSEWTEEAAE